MRPSLRAACLSDIRCLSNGTLAKLSGEHYFSKSRVPRQPPLGTPNSNRKLKNFGKEPQIGKNSVIRHRKWLTLRLRSRVLHCYSNVPTM
ncbi:hypothetical protein TNCT_37211 [Trichonephila clavata]|uniref:Uncharacterized protein n=1 Tax=Trichonephila clavata TaxID=2740835 RepID=A0A8X6IF40_TRICU|nr:hypothetical protein TNCT_37211 [Trichonephila clavata]